MGVCLSVLVCHLKVLLCLSVSVSVCHMKGRGLKQMQSIHYDPCDMMTSYPTSPFLPPVMSLTTTLSEETDVESRLNTLRLVQSMVAECDVSTPPQLLRPVGLCGTPPPSPVCLSLLLHHHQHHRCHNYHHYHCQD